MRKVMAIFGTRPEAIKLVTVIQEMYKYPGRLQPVVAVTAQHREMLDQVLRLFDVVPEYDLDIMKPAQTLFGVTAEALNGVSAIIEKERPWMVLIQGDTTSSFAAALAAFYLKTPVAHVEAGLRTHDKRQPFPEEMNRLLTSRLADWHFAPTERARQNLLREGVPPSSIWVTGNTVIDALLRTVKDTYVFEHPVLRQIDWAAQRVLLVTAHRRENWGDPIRNICASIRQIATEYADTRVIFSVHMNPEVRRVVHAELAGLDRVHLIEPLEYEPFVQLMGKCYLILTDSGGIQEEAPSLGKPVLVLRNVTERPEGVEAGTLKMVGTDPERILDAVRQLLDDPTAYRRMTLVSNPYGDGQASRRIAETLLSLGNYD